MEFLDASPAFAVELAQEQLAEGGILFQEGTGTDFGRELSTFVDNFGRYVHKNWGEIEEKTLFTC